MSSIFTACAVIVAALVVFCCGFACGVGAMCHRAEQDGRGRWVKDPERGRRWEWTDVRRSEFDFTSDEWGHRN